jgi:hypothetical protein
LAARWIASSIASITMPRSISFSLATESAIAISSARFAVMPPDAGPVFCGAVAMS